MDQFHVDSAQQIEVQLALDENVKTINVFRSTTQLKQMSGTLRSNLNTLQSGKPNFQPFTKDLNGCSWRAVAIFFIVLTIAMASTLAFVIGKEPRQNVTHVFTTKKKVKD